MIITIVLRCQTRCTFLAVGNKSLLPDYVSQITLIFTINREKRERFNIAILSTPVCEQTMENLPAFYLF